MKHLRSIEHLDQQHDNRGDSRGVVIVVLVLVTALLVSWTLFQRI